MARLPVRKIDRKSRAERSRYVTKQKDTSKGGLGSEIAGLFSKVGLDEEIPELRAIWVKSPSSS